MVFTGLFSPSATVCGEKYYNQVNYVGQELACLVAGPAAKASLGHEKNVLGSVL